MRGYFEDEERELEEPSRDTEVTLSPLAVAGIVLALLVLCGLCFGFGYWIGHRTSGRSQAPATQPLSQTAAPDEEPLQGSSSIPKPSAEAQVPVTPPAQASDGSQPQAQGANPTNPQEGTATQGQSAPAPITPASGQAQSQSPVRPAIPSTPGAAQTAGASFAQTVHSALPGANELMVQVAAVSHQEDASVLVNALRQHGYAASAQQDPSDGLIHVRVGPFKTREEANRMARRLLDDGYNAMVQP